jgi:hypothetical protein
MAGGLYKGKREKGKGKSQPMAKRALSLVSLILTLIPTPAGAHRLDEYLQATRVGIEHDRVNVDVDLTPGVSIAPQVMAWIDGNGDGSISSRESLAYGRQVLASLLLSIDGATVPLSLGEARAATVGEMTAGVGTLRVTASAPMGRSGRGRHQLTIVNAHHPESSVYLANALIPADKRIQILGQYRSQDQRRLTIEYEVGMSRGWTRMSWVLLGLSPVGALLWRRRLDHSTIVETRPI